MKNVQVDAEGNLHCWNCGASAFTEKRTGRAKAIGVTAGVVATPIAALGILGTKKKLRCQACGKYNDVGSADPVSGSKTVEAGPASSAGVWVKMTAGDLQPGDEVKQLGRTSRVEAVEAGKWGLTITTDMGKLRGIAKSTPMTVRRRS